MTRLFSKDADCEQCGEREKILTYNNSNNILSDFIDYLFTPQHNESILVAHYGGRYDFLILVQEMYKRNIIPSVLTHGRRIITGSVVYNKCIIHIRDSFNFIPLPLSSFKSAFALSSCQSKGEFPFMAIQQRFFHTKHKGLPPLRYYSTGSKSEKQLKEFMLWYKSVDPETFIFDFDEELLRYVRNDVDLLLMGMLEYRHALLQTTSIDPFAHVCTLASFTSLVLRCNHIPPRTLCNIPDYGFSYSQRQQSEIEYIWKINSKNCRPGRKM